MKKIVLPQMIDYFRKENGMTMDELGKRMGKTPSAISRWISGARSPMVEDLDKLANIFQVDVKTLMFGANEFEKAINDTVIIMKSLDHSHRKKVYEFSKNQLDEQNGISEMSKKYIVNNRCTAAGTPIDGDYEDAQQEIVVRNEVPRGADEVVTIAGDSMQPLLMRGSQAFVHYQPVPDYDGQIVIVSIKDIGVTCKKIYREDGKIRLKSINEKYSDMIYPAQDVRVIGKVITQKK
ncbi:helix-turn-helix domain-containing protein [Liquorilactobacillus nagelii]|jgi:phage repressor protein C with HTH and peptisase S24 domain|uniref:helix-turn-helix domain-containing protein n=1 Tax=Liquorilactobacillus nagelii TaxID=82688 RepID=UPI00242CD711|nr:XRE family transcriptional regulator [Liquorilactobacillus nagelii]MCI1634535.1 XRE family transcriptional regulator [Liquorilactobacillus nagelii]